ncbi:HlyD family efflux transporter periplasmic adaptor subunit [Paraburkholderia acidisoli]|uniref:HlyD family efflux transporter periplasmic adaptor subunit n=1 Tax=Paraburkholderia acidisoli TaxID=2571748 RepID=A0A7Z2GGI6_9BURK|nr:HlyD family efflux transporter periplasmic adaptor subunit [Paraburkholderia acidisoli]QGZ61392.1 HlyD family efflux transporter periplasmic adaptor subunit [Paraburkholderia acidisoli]
MEPTYLPEFRDIRWRWIGYGASALVVLGTAFAFTQDIERKQDVRCEIVSPSEIKVQGESGLVAAIYVQPPARVEAGQPLFRLERDLSLARGGLRRDAFDAQVRDEARRAADARYAQQRVDLNAQLATARSGEASRRAELAELDVQGAQNVQLIAESGRKLARLSTVSDYVTADRIEQARADLHQSHIARAESAARRQQTLAAIADLRNTQTALTAQLGELEAGHARDLQDADARFEQTRRDATISAPKRGVVTFSRLVPGSMLQASDIAMVIVTDSAQPLRAELRIPSRRRGFVREGQIVHLKFDAFPYAKFGSYEARIDSISRTTVGAAAPAPTPGVDAAAKPGADAADQGDAYVAWVTLRGRTFDYGNQRFDILPGMQATASIVVERRTIAEWVLEPLFKIMRG